MSRPNTSIGPTFAPGDIVTVQSNTADDGVRATIVKRIYDGSEWKYMVSAADAEMDSETISADDLAGRLSR